MNRINFDGLESPLLYTKFRGNRPVGLGEMFKGFIPYFGVVAILAMCPGCRKQTFGPPAQGGCT